MKPGKSSADIHNHWRIAVIAILAFALSACASVPYQSVEDGPRAQLTVRKATETSEFYVSLFKADESCDLLDLGVIDLQEAETERTVYVRPERIHFAIRMKEEFFGGQWHHVSFPFEENQSYLIEYEHRGYDDSVYPRRLLYRINYQRDPDGANQKISVDEFRHCDQ